MPTSVIHEIVGRKITKKYHYLDNYNFYLGIIAPDAVNKDGFAKKEDRWTAHLRDKDLKKWMDNIIFYYQENKTIYDGLFLKGYITHIITDIVYDQYLYDEVINKYNIPDNKQAHKHMLNQMNSYGLNNKDYQYVTAILNEKDISYNIRNIDKETLSKWKNKITNQILSKSSDLLINDEIIDKLTYLVIEELQKYKIL